MARGPTRVPVDDPTKAEAYVIPRWLILYTSAIVTAAFTAAVTVITIQKDYTALVQRVSGLVTQVDMQEYTRCIDDEVEELVAAMIRKDQLLHQKMKHEKLIALYSIGSTEVYGVVLKWESFEQEVAKSRDGKTGADIHRVAVKQELNAVESIDKQLSDGVVDIETSNCYRG
jgi:hypothetical protein